MKHALDDKQRDALHRKLQTRYDVLRVEIRAALEASDNEDYRKLAGEVADVGEEALADLLVDVRLAEIDRDIVELNEIKVAMARMRSNAYDVCTDCGAHIPYARLQAYPTAKRCEPCQREHERRFRTPSVNTL